MAALSASRLLADARAGAVDHLGATAGFAIGAAGCLGGALRTGGHLLHAGRHLVDRRGDLIGFALLARGAPGAAVHGGQQFMRVPVQLA